MTPNLKPIHAPPLTDYFANKLAPCVCTQSNAPKLKFYYTIRIRCTVYRPCMGPSSHQTLVNGTVTPTAGQTNRKEDKCVGQNTNSCQIAKGQTKIQIK